MLCILYVNVVGTLLGIVGLLVERVLPATVARRWVWCALIPISVFQPAIYQAQHNVTVREILEQTTAQSASAPQLGTASLNPLDYDFWAHAQAYNALIGRVWLAASALLIVWGLVSALRVALALRLERRRRSNSVTPVVLDGIPIVVTSALGPATVGLWRSRVLVPRWVLALPTAQRQYVLRHEDEHRKANDARLLFVASLTLILVPWNIALWWQLRRLRLAVEIDCDNRVVVGLGDAHAYGSLLLKVAEATSRGPRLQPALLGGMGMLERRLTMLLAPTPLQHVQRYLLPAAAFVLLIIVASMPHPVLGRAPETHATHSPPSERVIVSQR